MHNLGPEGAEQSQGLSTVDGDETEFQNLPEKPPSVHLCSLHSHSCCWPIYLPSPARFPPPPVLSLFLIPPFIIILSLGSSLLVARLPGSEWEQLHCLPDLAPGSMAGSKPTSTAPAADESDCWDLRMHFFPPISVKKSEWLQPSKCGL